MGDMARIFLEGVFVCAKQAVRTVMDTNKLFDNDIAKIATLGRARFSCKAIFEYLQKLPQVTVPLLARELNMTSPTARSSVNHMVSLGILEEMSGKKRDKVYIYR